ncbi:MAG: acyltransferase domain-containing protein, partial [Brachybacterium sp.]|nr:acyltransferase domain-containing protein [Brachybacterium sp.]
ITAIQIALTDLMTGLGLRPAAIVGQSMGEIAGAYAAGGLSMEDAVTIACHRARLMGEGEKLLPEDKQGAMAVIELGVEDLVEFQKENPQFAAVEPAVYAAPGMTTVGGPAQPVADLVAHLEGEGKFARMLKVKGAGHTSMLDPILGELHAEIAGITPLPIHTPVYSSVDRGVVYQPGDTVHDADYFLRCTRYSVWLSDATGRLFDEGFRTFVEFSPNPVALSVRGVPGRRVALPDGRTAFAVAAAEVPSVDAVAEAAARAVVPDAVLAAVETYGSLPTEGEVTTLVARTLGGLSVQVYAMDGADESRLAGEAFAASPAGGMAAGVAGAAGAAGASSVMPQTEPAAGQGAGARNALPSVDTDSERWTPESGQSVADRLRSIVSESMGYDVDDLPGELPLIDLGLDSLMGMRIKNRVEYDFDLPSLNVQALRDGSVDEVISLVEQMVQEKLDGVTHTPAAEGAETAADAAPAAEAAAAAASQGVGVAPRDASERMVFGTWASLTGAAPAGVTSALPQVDADTAAAIAARLSERSGAEISATQVAEAGTLEPLANLVRDVFETAVDGNIRVLRARPEGSDSPAVFVFHPAGGSSVVYEPLTRRLPADVPV